MFLPLPSLPGLPTHLPLMSILPTLSPSLSLHLPFPLKCLSLSLSLSLSIYIYIFSLSLSLSPSIFSLSLCTLPTFPSSPLFPLDLPSKHSPLLLSLSLFLSPFRLYVVSILDFRCLFSLFCIYVSLSFPSVNLFPLLC